MPSVHSIYPEANSSYIVYAALIWKINSVVALSMKCTFKGCAKIKSAHTPECHYAVKNVIPKMYI